MKISVVIGTYNQKETLKPVLQSFFNQSLPANEYEIILVDSFSTDGTDAMVEQLKIPCRFNYLRRENRGKSAARNFGVNRAKGEIILLTDADMVADRELLGKHLLAHAKHKNAAIEGLTYNLKKPIAVKELSLGHPDLIPYITRKLRPRQKLSWSYFLSGNLSFRKEAFVKAGGFDENFSGYGWEDIELGYRFRKLRVPLLWEPTAINYHFHFVSGEDMLKRKYNMGRSAAYFYKKHPNFEIRMFLGMNPLAMGIFNLLKAFPKLKARIKNQYILEEYSYRSGLVEGLKT